MAIDVEKLRSEFTDPHYLVKTRDKSKLFIRAWNPPPEKKNGVVVLILHGITAYSGPYAMIGIPLSEAGYTVLCLDYRGHGLSDGIRGDYRSRRQIANDIKDAVEFIRDNIRPDKLVLMGHSLGVAASGLALYHCEGAFAGAILMSGARKFRPEVYPSLNFGDKFKILFSSIFAPRRPVINYQREGMVGLDDPLFNFNYTFRFMRLIDSRKMAVPKITFPLLMGVGDEDELFEVSAVKELFDEIPAEDKEFFVIKGGRHAIFPDDAWQPLIDWLNKKFID